MTTAAPISTWSPVAVVGAVLAAAAVVCTLFVPGPMSLVFGGLGAVAAISFAAIALAKRSASRKTRTLAVCAIVLGSLVLLTFTAIHLLVMVVPA